MFRACVGDTSSVNSRLKPQFKPRARVGDTAGPLLTAQPVQGENLNAWNPRFSVLGESSSTESAEWRLNQGS